MADHSFFVRRTNDNKGPVKTTCASGADYLGKKTAMRKIVSRIWLLNFLGSIALFVMYRIVISETKSPDGNFLETVIAILSILLSLGYSLIYLVGMVISSFAFILNLIPKVRNSVFLSLLTFCGIPLAFVLFITIGLWIDVPLRGLTAVTTLAVFSVAYLIMTTLAFALFRKRIRKFERGMNSALANA